MSKLGYYLLGWVLGFLVGVTLIMAYPSLAHATVSCRTGANGYTYCVDSKTGKAFIIKPQPGGGIIGGST